MKFVLDCSVTMAWCFEDESNAYTDSVLERLHAATAVVPGLWHLEVANVLIVATRRKRLARADAERFLQLLSGLNIAVDDAPAAPAGRLTFEIGAKYG